MVTEMVTIAVPERYKADQPTIAELRAMSLEQRSERSMARRKADASIRMAIAKPGSWVAIDQEVRSIVESTEDVPRYELEQVASTLMLSHHLTGSIANDPEKADAIMHHVSQLVSNESSNADLIVEGLGALPERYRPTEVQALAAQALQTTSAKLEAVSDCTSCSTKELIEQLDVGATRGLAGASQESLEQLQALAAD